jgi:hypothetical protein
MNRLDLIIAGLTEATQARASDQYGVDYRVCCGGDTEFDHVDCIPMQALAAARELKALKPVAYVGDLNEFDAMRLKSEGFQMHTPLYALDEVTK